MQSTENEEKGCQMELVFDTRINLSTMFIHLIYALPSHLMRKKKSFNCREQLIRNDEIPLHSTKYKIITFHEIRDDPLSIWVYFLLKLKMGIFHLNIDWKKKAKLDFSRFLPFFMHLRMFFPREKKKHNFPNPIQIFAVFSTT